MKLQSALKYLLVLFLFAGTSCEKTILEPTFTFGKQSTFRLNELYTSSDGYNTLMITEIDDSRCPIGLECFWQGEVSLKGEWTANTNKSTFELHSELKSLDKQSTGFVIQIIDVKPYPDVHSPSKPADKEVTLLISPKMY
jgi:hypothetical protein